MRSRLNSEGHDESQYLPTKWFNPKLGKEEPYPVINAYRMAKGDIIRNEDDKLESPKWLPRLLSMKPYDINGNPYLNGDYLHICQRIERATISAMALMGVTNLRVFISSDRSELSSLPINDPFNALMTKLLPYQSEQCMWLICDERNRGNTKYARQIISSLRNSLDMAKIILDDLRESAKVVNVASGDVCLD